MIKMFMYESHIRQYTIIDHIILEYIYTDIHPQYLIGVIVIHSSFELLMTMMTSRCFCSQSRC